MVDRTLAGERGMTEASEWTGRMGGNWAREWQRTDRSFAPLTERLLDHPAMREFAAALDIGCGAGELSCRLAARVPQAQVTGVDISSELLAVARARCAGPEFVEADAASFRPAGPAPDLLVSRHGVMFFADPFAAFAHLAAIAAPGAALRFSCFRTRTENEWALRLASIVPGDAAFVDPAAPGPFAFGNRERTARILGSTGWCDVDFEAFDFAMVGGEGENAVADAHSYFQHIGSAARALAGLDGEERELALVRLRALLAGHHEDNRVALPAAAWIVTARAPG